MASPVSDARDQMLSIAPPSDMGDADALAHGRTPCPCGDDAHGGDCEARNEPVDPSLLELFSTTYEKHGENRVYGIWTVHYCPTDRWRTTGPVLGRGGPVPTVTPTGHLLGRRQPKAASSAPTPGPFSGHPYRGAPPLRLSGHQHALSAAEANPCSTWPAGTRWLAPTPRPPKTQRRVERAAASPDCEPWAPSTITA